MKNRRFQTEDTNTESTLTDIFTTDWKQLRDGSEQRGKLSSVNRCPGKTFPGDINCTTPVTSITRSRFIVNTYKYSSVRYGVLNGTRKDGAHRGQCPRSEHAKLINPMNRSDEIAARFARFALTTLRSSSLSGSCCIYSGGRKNGDLVEPRITRETFSHLDLAERSYFFLQSPSTDQRHQDACKLCIPWNASAANTTRALEKDPCSFPGILVGEIFPENILDGDKNF